MNARKSAISLWIAVLATVAVSIAPAQASTTPHRPPQDSTNCTFTTVETIRLEGKGGTYSITEAGALSRGSSTTVSGCADGSEVTPMASVALGTKVFTPSARTFTKTDGNGTFNGQYTVGSPYYVAFSYTISAALQGIATGSASASVRRTPAAGTCSYSKLAAVNYFFHWSCTTPYNQTQALRGVWTFPIVVSGVKGTATIDWVFNYRIDETACAPGVPC